MRFGVSLAPPAVIAAILWGAAAACVAPKSPPQATTNVRPTPAPADAPKSAHAAKSRAAATTTEERPPPWLAARCTAADPALTQVAVRVAKHEVSGQDGEAVARALRTAGSAYVGPRSWMLSAQPIDPATADVRLSSWVGKAVHPVRRHCGIAFARSNDSTETAAVIMVDAWAEPELIPLRTSSPSWVRFNADTQVVPKSAKVIALGPTRSPTTVPTTVTGRRISALIPVDERGPWLLQLLLDTGAGPLPALEAAVFADVEPTEEAWLGPVPGEQVAPTPADRETGSAAPGAGPTSATPGAGPTSATPGAGPTSAAEPTSAAPGTATVAEVLGRMLNRARDSAGVAELPSDAELEAVARKHARAMRRIHQLAHDTGDGDPTERTARAHMTAGAIGENLSHAASAVLAHRALWFSPSHRMNLLDPRFGRVGIGVEQDGDGSYWIVELFASQR